MVPVTYTSTLTFSVEVPAGPSSLLDLRKAELHKVAPGYNPSALLLPTSQSPVPPHGPQSSIMDAGSPTKSTTATSLSTDPMDDLVSQLELMEKKR